MRFEASNSLEGEGREKYALFSTREIAERTFEQTLDGSQVARHVSIYASCAFSRDKIVSNEGGGGIYVILPLLSLRLVRSCYQYYYYYYYWVLDGRVT